MKVLLTISLIILFLGVTTALTIHYLPDFVPQVADIFSYKMINGEFVEQHIRGGEIIGNRTIPIID